MGQKHFGQWKKDRCSRADSMNADQGSRNNSVVYHIYKYINIILCTWVTNKRSNSGFGGDTFGSIFDYGGGHVWVTFGSNLDCVTHFWIQFGSSLAYGKANLDPVWIQFIVWGGNSGSTSDLGRITGISFLFF